MKTWPIWKAYYFLVVQNTQSWLSFFAPRNHVEKDEMSTGGREMGRDQKEEGLWVDESLVAVSRKSTRWGFNDWIKEILDYWEGTWNTTRAERCNVRGIMEKDKFHHLKGRRKISKPFHVQWWNMWLCRADHAWFPMTHFLNIYSMLIYYL